LLLHFSSFAAHRPPPSFPTRRSSDLRRCRRPVSSWCQSVRSRRSSEQWQPPRGRGRRDGRAPVAAAVRGGIDTMDADVTQSDAEDRKSTRLNSSHVKISYAVFCLKKK